MSFDCVIFGAGSLGMVFGGLLAERGHRVRMVGRRRHVEAIRRDGVHVEGIWGEHAVRVEQATETVQELGGGTPELVLICVKSFHTAAAVEAIRAAGVEEECVITSLDYGVLREVRALAPELPLGMIVTARVGRIERLDVDFYSAQPNLATVSFIREAHERGREVHVWTLNDAKRIARFADRGVNSIITDHPKLAISVLEARTEADELYAAIMRLFRSD